MSDTLDRPSDTLNEPVVLNHEDIDRLPTVVLPDLGEGVSSRVLWQVGKAQGGLMRIRADGRLNAHTHRASYHDMWLVEGTCTVLGRLLGPGSYVHIPAGVEHGIEAGPNGCSFFYVYRQG